MISALMLVMQMRGVLSVAAWLMWVAGVILLAGSLFAAGIMDLKEQMVYRFLWLIGGLGVAILGIVKMREAGGVTVPIIDLGIFILLQQVWFARFYGRADCHAFCLCSAAMYVLELGGKDYVIHMLLTFVGLTIVQLFRQNIACDWKLVNPVPLIPYITVTFWLWVDFASGKWYI